MSANAHARDSSGASALETARLECLSNDALDRVAAIYEEAFPARQRVPFDELVAAARRGDEIALIGLEQGRPVGFAFIRRLASVAYLFLEYYAVADGLRGAGRGQSLWNAISDEIVGREARHPIVLEVEDPSEAQLGAAAAAQRERRVRFWERVGARALPVEGYIIPNIDGTGVEPARLMWMPDPPDREDPGEEDLLKLIIALYEEGYGLHPDNALVQRALRVWG